MKPSASNQRHVSASGGSAASKPRRGGRRPGAGAPPGNLNALKHGRRSAQFAQLGALLATLPDASQALLAIARRRGCSPGLGGCQREVADSDSVPCHLSTVHYSLLPLSP